MGSNSERWYLTLFLLISAPLMNTSVAEPDHPNIHLTVKCDACELLAPPPPPPACPPPPPPPCPPPPPKSPSCIPCSATPEVYLPPPPPPPVAYIIGGPGNVYVTDPYGADMYSGHTRICLAGGITTLLALWALLKSVV